MKQFDWSQPQRQPVAGLVLAFLNTFWQILKGLWPVLLLMLLGNREVNSYEIIAILIVGLTVVGAFIRFLFFRFYIDQKKLIIKTGWLKKETKIIPLERIQTVHIEQGPFHQVLNIVKLSIDTPGSKKAEASIDALHQSMAEALRDELLSEKTTIAGDEEVPVVQAPVLTLNTRDLLRLSISANHLEAFFILLSFIFGLYENLRNINNNIFSGLGNAFPETSFYPVLILVIAILIITILVSTGRIFFNFYDFNIVRTPRGFRIKSGLLNVKERLISFPKIQYVSWRANWIRKLMGLWMMEYHVAGTDENINKHRVQIPVTQEASISQLVTVYNPQPLLEGLSALRMHPSFVSRCVLVIGLAPLVVLIPALWLAWGENAFFLLGLPAFVWVITWCQQRKFRLWATDDLLVIRRGIFGEEKIYLRWHKLQSAQLKQSIYQRSKGLANLVVYTAGGTIRIRFIPLEAARLLSDFILFKTESTKESWL